MARFVVVCPKGFATGGPEALHQLAHALTIQGRDAYLWDPDNHSRQSESHTGYEGYQPVWTSIPPSPSDVVFIPEVYGELIPKFYLECVVVFWWLSLDNFFKADRIPIEAIQRCFPNVVHGYQSEYARCYLESLGVRHVFPLSDYINPDFISSPNPLMPPINEKRGLKIAINPAKGFTRTKLILDSMNGHDFIRLEDMSRKDLIQSLKSADVYIDLGDHPGVDRIPREAALLNCLVITNQRGSAGNSIDLPILSEVFKFDDTKLGFELNVKEFLNKVRIEPMKYIQMQDGYRESIALEKNRFLHQVAQLTQHLDSDNGQSALKSEESTQSFTAFISNVFRERDAAREELDAAREERDAAREELESIRTSLSWTITSPIRRFTQGCRRIRNGYKKQ